MLSRLLLVLSKQLKQIVSVFALFCEWQVVRFLACSCGCPGDCWVVRHRWVLDAVSHVLGEQFAEAQQLLKPSCIVCRQQCVL